jgi:hypothetical protein
VIFVSIWFQDQRSSSPESATASSKHLGILQEMLKYWTMEYHWAINLERSKTVSKYSKSCMVRVKE